MYSVSTKFNASTLSFSVLNAAFADSKFFSASISASVLPVTSFSAGSLSFNVETFPATSWMYLASFPSPVNSTLYLAVPSTFISI